MPEIELSTYIIIFFVFYTIYRTYIKNKIINQLEENILFLQYDYDELEALNKKADRYHALR